jgi:VWFA-related protein
MHTYSRCLIVLSVLAAVGWPAVFAQQPNASQTTGVQPTIPLPTKGPEVLLAITVRDKRGELVNNLSGVDVALTEDGRPQQIRSFARDSKAPLRLGLAIDTSRSLQAAMNDERKAAGNFLAQMMPDEAKSGVRANEAFLLHFDREVELLQDFTSSREKLQHELDNIGPTSGASHSPEGPETNDEDRTNGRRRGGAGGTQFYDAIYLAADELMKQKDGRKVLVIFCDGEDHGSKETLNDAIDAADRANLAIYAIYFKGQGERSENPFPGSGRHGGGYPGGGGGYPGGGGGYPGGGGGYPGGGGGYPGGNGGGRGGDHEAQSDGKKIMEKIATRTGGRYFEAKKGGNLEDIYNQIADELRNQYVLTYTPDQKINEDEYHKIVVKAKRDDLTVATREGYYAPDSK